MRAVQGIGLMLIAFYFVDEAFFYGVYVDAISSMLRDVRHGFGF